MEAIGFMKVYLNIGKYVRNINFEDIPSTAVESAKRILLDSLGCMIAGSRFLNLKDQSHPLGSFTIVGVGRGYSREWAVLINGNNLVATEMDEGNQFAKGHPAAHFLPALLAEAETKPINGKEFLTALVVAYEVAARIGSSITLKKYIHPHGNWGTGSSAVAIAKLRGLGINEIAEAILLGCSLPVTSVWSSVLTGSNIRNSYIGISNLIGLMVPDMVRCGIKSHADVVSSVYGEALGISFHPELLDEGLGEEYLIEKNYLKIYSCCRFIHGAVDCVLNIKEELKKKGRDLKPEDIQSVNVETYELAATLRENKPPNAFAAKFSIPFSIALLLSRGSLTNDVYRDECVEDQKLLELSKRVTVSEDPSLSALLPKVRATRVTIHLKDGLSIGKEVHSTTGDYTCPLSNEQIINKFYYLAQPSIGRSACLAIAEMVFSLEKIGQISDLIRLLVPGNGHI